MMSGVAGGGLNARERLEIERLIRRAKQSLSADITQIENDIYNIQNQVDGIDTGGGSNNYQDQLNALYDRATDLEQRVLKLEVDLTKYTDDVVAWSDRLEAAESTIETVQGEAETLTGKVNDIEGGIDTLDGQVESLTNDVSAVQDKLGDIPLGDGGATGSIGSTLGTLTSGLAAATSGLSTLGGFSTSAMGGLAGTAGLVTAVGGLITTTAAMQNSLNDVEDAITALELRADDIEDLNTTQNTKLTQYNSRIQAAQLQINENEIVQNDLVTRVGTAEGKITTNISDITGIKSAATALTSRVGIIESGLVDINDHIANIEPDIVTLFDVTQSLVSSSTATATRFADITLGWMYLSKVLNRVCASHGMAVDQEVANPTFLINTLSIFTLAAATTSTKNYTGQDIMTSTFSRVGDNLVINTTALQTYLEQTYIKRTITNVTSTPASTLFGFQVRLTASYMMSVDTASYHYLYVCVHTSSITAPFLATYNINVPLLKSGAAPTRAMYTETILTDVYDIGTTIYTAFGVQSPNTIRPKGWKLFAEIIVCVK